MERSVLHKSFISIVKLGIGHRVDALSLVLDWKEIRRLAEKQGLYAVVLDAIEMLPVEKRPSQEILLEWIGEVLQGYEYRYEQYSKIHTEMASFYNRHGYKMMVLKGYVCSLDWPQPEHRPCGDIDIWQFGDFKQADAILSSEKGIKIDDSHEHHTIFYWRDFMVENHYDFIDVHHRKSSPQLESIFKELGKDDSHWVDLTDASTGSKNKIYLPSPNLHALFLLRHCMEHFASTEITIRQLLDWAFFVEKHTEEIDWTWLENVLDKFGMSPAYSIFNAICVEDLGFDSNIFPNVHFNPLLKERVLNDILSPEFTNEEPSGTISRVLYKYSRWKANGWKNELCFKESMWSAFWSGVWGHILKPSQI